MIKNTFFLLSVVSLLVACHSHSEFTIEKGRVGPITKDTRVNELKALFAKDSVVAVLNDDKEAVADTNNFYKEDDQYMIYQKGGKHLLTIIPIELNDSSHIKSVEIFDNRYKTKKGISLYSPFKDVYAAYKLSITNTILSAHIDIDELNATMSIDKKDIGINEFNRDNIKPEQIPDLTKIKHFTIWFN